MNCQHPPNLVLTILDDETSMVQWCKDCGSVRYVIKGTDKRFGEVDKSVPDHYLPWDTPNHANAPKRIDRNIT